MEELLNIEEKIASRLIELNATLSVAESCTGGMISHVVTCIPGSSAYYLGGVTSYAIRIKEQVLGVPSDIIEKYGVVSVQVASSMAEGVRELMGSTYSVATTGLAGPGGDEHNPEGTVCIAVSGPEGTVCKRFIKKGERMQNIHSFTLEALTMLLSVLK